MTIEEAKKVKEWRCGDGSKVTGSWRWVASRAAKEWPEKNLAAGSQFDGIDLCKEAATLLGEDPWSHPWN